MDEDEGREVIIFTDDFKIKGRVRIGANEDVIPTTGTDPYLDLFDVTVYDQAGSLNIGRSKRLKLRRTAIQMYFFEEDSLGKVR